MQWSGFPMSNSRPGWYCTQIAAKPRSTTENLRWWSIVKELGLAHGTKCSPDQAGRKPDDTGRSRTVRKGWSTSLAWDLTSFIFHLFIPSVARTVRVRTIRRSPLPRMLEALGPSVPRKVDTKRFTRNLGRLRISAD